MGIDDGGGLITKSELNEDQLKSFDQMTSSGGLSEEKALEFIQEFCIDKGLTGLVAHCFSLTPKGRMAAINLLPELRAREPLNN